MTRVVVIMAGGSGERFWPLSTSEEPKQLLRLTNSGKMLLEEAIDRAEPIVGFENVYVSTSQRLADRISDSGLIPRERILDEPLKRNTLGAVLWSVSRLEREFGSSFTVAFTTADHLIEPDHLFQQDILRAMMRAEDGDHLTIMGIPPSRPETGYGYLEVGEDDRVVRFTEKPDEETAQQYVESGRYLWNSGMFFMTANGLRRALEAIDADMAQTYDRLVRDDAAFEDVENISFDFAVLEKVPDLRYVPATFRWDDIGAWDALLRTTSTDTEGNALVGLAQVADACGNVVYSRPGVRVSLLGVKDLAVVVTESEVMVIDLHRAQDVRRLATDRS